MISQQAERRHASGTAFTRRPRPRTGRPADGLTASYKPLPGAGLR